MASNAADNMATQLQCVKQGGPMETVKAPKPDLGPKDVLIAQRAIAFNLVDIKMRDYGVMVPHWPFVIGLEGAGTVEAVGEAVHDLKPGDEVMAWEAGPGWGGAFQEYVAAPRRWVAEKPANISMTEAASIVTCYVTAVSIIIESLDTPLSFLPEISTKAPSRPPKSVLVLGGSSAVGAAVIQLLRRAYPDMPILTTSSSKHEAKVRDLGASAIIDYRKADTVVADVRAASPGGSGVDAIVDCVDAGVTQTDICEALDPAGSRRYSDLLTGRETSVPSDVTRVQSSAHNLFPLSGSETVIPALTRLVQEGLYKVPLPVKVVGHGLEEIPKVMDMVKTASGEKLILTL